MGLSHSRPVDLVLLAAPCFAPVIATAQDIMLAIEVYARLFLFTSLLTLSVTKLTRSKRWRDFGQYIQEGINRVIIGRDGSQVPWSANEKHNIDQLDR
jgi:hypothetical protein